MSDPKTLIAELRYLRHPKCTEAADILEQLTAPVDDAEVAEFIRRQNERGFFAVAGVIERLHRALKAERRIVDASVRPDVHAVTARKLETAEAERDALKCQRNLDLDNYMESYLKVERERDTALAVIERVREWRLLHGDIGSESYCITTGFYALDRTLTSLPTDSADTEDSEQNAWECGKCGIANPDENDWCETCNADRPRRADTEESDG